jgi:hypothetical protein
MPFQEEARVIAEIAVIYCEDAVVLDEEGNEPRVPNFLQRVKVRKLPSLIRHISSPINVRFPIDSV